MVITTRTVHLLTVATVTVWTTTLFSEPAAAEGSGMYVGTSFGRVLSTYRHSDLDRALASAFNNEITLGSTSIRRNETTWSVDIGYMASSHFGVEASYLNLGTLKYRAAGTETAAGGGKKVSVNVNMKSRGPTLALLGVVPMTNAWEVDARIGAYSGKTSTGFTSVVGPDTHSGSDSKASVSLLIGVGSSYTVSEHWAFRLDYIRLNHVSEKIFNRAFSVDLVTAGLTYAL
jgi:opacity protein-like surface antigen